MKILIVEDDNFYARYVSEMLQDRGIETVVVQSAQEALKTDVSGYEGAVVDVMLPNDDAVSGISVEESRGGFYTGVAVARRLLQSKPGLKIVILSADLGSSEAEAWAKSKTIPFVRKSGPSEALVKVLNNLGLLGARQTPLAFIVHGHDETSLLELKNYIQNTLKWQEPIVLREQANAGKTIIEKFEDHASKVDCVFVLLTPDDQAVSGDTNDQKRRSRQNVIFELGFFCGALDRSSGRIVLLHKGPVELPSDIAGVVWVDISNGIDAAGETIRKEVKAVMES
ncbi:MAG TPA: TIR domain-containing protein [Terriglobales bacterium]|jgi:CheY-like chemotaxis protein|nr:TIR domain-containing protein [Terriglobales bacterium]